MKVLAVDTTTAWGSVAVASSGDVLGEVRLCASGSHSSRVLPDVEFLLGCLELAVEDLDGFAVTLGPGSFTGLRVGIATVQGLALGLERPCLGVSALDVLAARAAGEAEVLAAMMDAWRGEVYGAIYDRQARLLGGPWVETPAAFLSRLPEAPALIGDAVGRHRDAILAERPAARFPCRSLYLAGTLARLAGPRILAGEGGGPEGLLPLYVRPPDAVPPKR
ncbi:MAG: tRNA (adenosine(37)-N6)-threonylcarbamoyltransferase complex dimerization subunit type 1 TsaB [Vicinamibacteria bacterium]